MTCFIIAMHCDIFVQFVHHVDSYCANRSCVSCFPFESFQVRVPSILSDKQGMVDEGPFRKQVYETVT
jgi:hypothetical protein